MSQNLETNDIATHPFVISVLENMHPIQQSVSKQFSLYLKQKKSSKSGDKQGDFDWTPQLTYEQAYHNEVFEYMHNTIEAFEKLREIPFFIRRFPNSQTFKKEGITLHKWVHYHYSNYLVTVVSLSDIILLLTNAVFLIGLKPRDCNDSTIAQNQRVVGSRVKDSIDNLRKIVKPYREPRNLFIHRFKLPNLEKLDQFGRHQFILDSEKALGISQEYERDDIFMNPYVVKNLYRHERSTLIGALQEQTGNIADAVKNIFDALHHYYESYSNQLKTAMQN